MVDTIKDIMERESLFPINGSTCNTYKFTKHPYLEDYEALLRPYQEKKIKLLEIGADLGASAILWDRYFPYGDITVVDINTTIALTNTKNRLTNRTNIVQADAYDTNFVNTLNSKYDIVLDDGPHDRESQLKCLDIYYPLLNEDGILIIEDIDSDSWLSELTAKIPEGKSKIIDYVARGQGAGDSRLFICWK
jgi:predicted O-methyltransferase YrrM